MITKTDNNMLDTPNNNNDKLLYIDTNIQKKSKMNNKNTIKKNNSEIKKYLLAPYFLRIKLDDDFYINEIKDEEIILNEIKEYKNKKGIKNRFPPCSNMLYRNLKPIENNNYSFKKEKIYFVQNDNDNIENENSNKNKMKYKNELILFQNIYNKKNQNEKEITNLKELFENDDKIIIINKLFQLIFEQKFELKDEYLSSIKKLFLDIENLEYFLNMIVPDNLLRSKENIFTKPLTVSSFKSFSKIIKLCFESINLTDNNFSRLLTLACFIYYKLEKDKIIYLYSEFLFNKLDKSQNPYLLWNNESFWIEFFNLEFELNNKEIELQKENISFSENDDKNNDKININNSEDTCNLNKNKKMCLLKTIMTLSTIMIKLNINTNFVINIIEKMILPVFVDDFYFIKEIMNLALTVDK